MHPKFLSINDYTYLLPEDRIAKHPFAKRDESKLLIYENENIEADIYSNLTNYLPTDSLLIFNNTKVIEARLLFKKKSGATIELFCLEPDERYKDITTAMLQTGKVLWNCLIGGVKKWKEEFLLKEVLINNTTIHISAKVIEKKTDCFLIEFNWHDTKMNFAELLHHAGSIPLPPYLKRDAEESDKKNYQTIYADNDGSVAAPTAGLHFTKELLNKISAKNIATDFVTLHVGAGTFKPVKAALMKDHEMHAEFIDVSITSIEKIIAHSDKTIVAVGTTSLRTIESLYWMGVKISQWSIANSHLPSKIDDIIIHQWNPYHLPQNISVKQSLLSLINWMKENKLNRLLTKTQIIIAPGYDLKIAKGLITNFHQPQSTLLLLVAAIVGEDWRKIYDYALKNNFRFLSFGDGSLLWKHSTNQA